MALSAKHIYKQRGLRPMVVTRYGVIRTHPRKVFPRTVK
jgi:hypothetical protein